MSSKNSVLMRTKSNKSSEGLNLDDISGGDPTPLKNETSTSNDLDPAGKKR
jgi:hypothetical protein